MLSTVLENNIPLQTVVPIVVFSMCRDVLVLSLAIWTIVRKERGPKSVYNGHSPHVLAQRPAVSTR
jgi:hypothetical protein